MSSGSGGHAGHLPPLPWERAPTSPDRGLALLRPPIHTPYRHHPVTSITTSAVPTANPDATATFVTGGEAGKRKLRLMILRYINAAMERAHYEIIEDAEPFYGSIPGIQGVWATGEIGR